MSTLEERRAARRRAREQAEKEDDSINELSAALKDRLEKRRKEREERLKQIASGVSAINGEDDFERRRRERREQRLLLQEKTDGGEAAEDTTSRRSRRRRGEEDDTDSSAVTETRTRRRRNDDEETNSTAPEPVVVDEETKRRQREQEEEEARQREELEERRQQEAEERRRQQEEERRREEEEFRRREEEKERKREEEERRRRQDHNHSDDAQNCTSANAQREFNQHERAVILRAFAKSEAEEQEKWWRRMSTDDANDSDEGKCEKLKHFFEERLHSEETDSVDDHASKTKINPAKINKGHLPDSEDTSLNRVQEHLTKFETHVKLQHSPKDINSQEKDKKHTVVTPGNERLKDIQKRFEQGSELLDNSLRLGKHSASEMNLHSKKDFQRQNSQGRVVDRWQSALDAKKEIEHYRKTSIRSSTSSLNEDSDEAPVLRKSSKISLLSAKFNTLDLSHLDENSSPFEKKASVQRRWSQNSFDGSSDSGERTPRSSLRNSVTSLSQKWETNSDRLLSSPCSSTPKFVRSTSNKENTSKRSSFSPRYDQNQNITKALEEEERLERERQEQEEREREERERLERERIEQERLRAEQEAREEEERQAARRMAEEQKKKKRKGLGGLSPEKKKMLKDEHENNGQITHTSQAEEHKRKVLGHRYVEDLPDLTCMDKGALQRLCKKLHGKLKDLEEEVYDWEMKIKKQDFEINELTIKVNDQKGKFMKPVLRKVNKTESKLEKFHAKKDKADFRDQLKSTGQNKYALEGKE